MHPSIKPLAWTLGRFYWLTLPVAVSYKKARRLTGVTV